MIFPRVTNSQFKVLYLLTWIQLIHSHNNRLFKWKHSSWYRQQPILNKNVTSQPFVLNELIKFFNTGNVKVSIQIQIHLIISLRKMCWGPAEKHLFFLHLRLFEKMDYKLTPLLEHCERLSFWNWRPWNSLAWAQDKVPLIMDTRLSWKCVWGKVASELES